MHSSDLSDLSVEPSTIGRLTSEQKARLTDILDRYLSALGSDVPPEREELLKDHPDLAESLQTYFVSLDELHDMAAGFGGSPDGPATAEDQSQESDEKRLGDFRLLREIGRGGMGVVYEARQISLDRRVALKVLPFAAVLDSKQIARFKNEAQAAAQLDHPNIVSVYAVGSERGVHYYAMRFIDGQPLDRAIAELRGAARFPSNTAPGAITDTTLAAEADNTKADDVCPSTCDSFLTANSTDPHEHFRTALRLGIQAAEALHAAHEFGVVHRDVKPSNLLLDGDGKLWVTDFGLARCRTDKALTRTGDVVGTLRYMSPEQAAGQSALVDHRTDVYALGVTLYELLALEPAFPGDDGPALLRLIDEREPRRLGQLQPRIPRDLETVVMKAMAKRREDRYTTAGQFADDLRRVLEGRPTIARPPTIPDRLGKWAHRHRRIVTAVAAVGLVAVLGMAASTLLITREKLKTEHNFQRAEKYFRGARDAVDRFGVQLAERLAGVPGADQVRRGLLQDTLQYYRDFVEEARDDPSLRADLALTYSKIGTLADQIGSSEEAIDAHENALQLFEQLAADEPRVEAHRGRVAVCRNNLGLLLARCGRTDEARRAYCHAIGLQEELVDGAEDGEQYQSDLALSHNNLGLLQSETGELKDAEASFDEAIRLQERLLVARPDDPEHLRNIAASLNNLSTLYVGEEPARAADLYKKVLSYQEKAAATRPDELKYRSDVALTYNNLGAVQSHAEQLSDAVVSYGQAIEIQRELVRAAPAQKCYRHDLAVSFNNLGLTQSKLRQVREAERSFRQALELQGILVNQNPYDLDLHSSLGGIYNNLGIVLEELERVAEAAEAYRKAVEHQQVACSHAPKVSRYRLFLSKHCYNYGRVLRELGRPDEAARVALVRRKLWPDDPRRLYTVAEELALAGKLLCESRQTGTTAEECAGYAIETLQQAVESGLELPADLYQNEAFAALKDHRQFAELVKK